MKKLLLLIFLSFVLLLILLFDIPGLKNEKVRFVSNHSFKESSVLKETKIPEGFQENKHEPITIIFAGDALFDNSVKETVRLKGPDYPFVFVKEEVEKADYAIVNLETSVTTTATKKDTSQRYNFKSDPISLQGIKNAGFDMVSLANNHALDYQIEGFIDTMNHLQDYELEFIGAGLDEKDAYRGKTIEIKGKKIKFLGFSRFMPSTTWYAGENNPGIASGYQEERVLEVIERERIDCDALFVYIHWGVEMNNRPENWQREYAKKMIHAGADGIIGAHPHVLQGFEYIDGKPVAYSIGNFLFPNWVTGRQTETGLLTLTLSGDEINMSFSPYKIQQDQIIKVDDIEKNRMLTYLEDISYGVFLQEHYIVAK